MSFIITKDPQADLDYGFDWAAWLTGAETIVSSTWNAGGLTSHTRSISGSTTITWLSGGTAGQQYCVTNTITTSAGRIDERTFEVICEDR